MPAAGPGEFLIGPSLLLPILLLTVPENQYIGECGRALLRPLTVRNDLRTAPGHGACGLLPSGPVYGCGGRVGVYAVL